MIHPNGWYLTTCRQIDLTLEGYVLKEGLSETGPLSIVSIKNRYISGNASWLL